MHSWQAISLQRNTITVTYATFIVPYNINNNHMTTMLYSTEMQTSLSLAHETRLIYVPATC